MAHKNAKDAAQKRAIDFATKRARTLGACEQLREALGMVKTPRRIECYDISNTQGSLSIGAMSVFIEGKSSPKDYRQFRIRTVEGPNDFASMAEIITRRFNHAMKETEELREQGKDIADGKFTDLPDAVLIDGGPEQLRFAIEAAKETGIVPFPFFFSLAERFEEVYLPGNREPILLDRHSEALHLLQRLRDEAHRFGITQHRKLRGKESVKSRLEEAPGIGPARRRALLNHFRTMEGVKRASAEDLATVHGMSKPAADSLYAFLHS
jgi:excinuclease ABC subunit C